MPATKRILIVDDERDLVETLTYRLEALGYEVLTAYDGQEGLDRVREEKPDLILLDVMMPKLDGYHVCRLIKFDDDLKGIPIIMLTARGQPQDRQTGRDSGADDYLTKPFESAVLLEKIQQLLKPKA
ncbi:MAG: adenylate/guanylate cyclase [uncultured bacterium]|nr:MAG: adenylate/guanylate cyclase [uncultured bacterium]HLD43869.1 response regulator [bacterium]